MFLGYRRLFTLTGAALLLACRPHPELPNDREDEDRDEENPVDTDTGEPASFDPRCDLREEEPNDHVFEAQPLPLLDVVCGDFGSPGDSDWYRVVMPHEGWFRVQVEAKPLGSFADTFLLVQGQDGTVATRDNDLGTTDSSLVFPAEPQVYEIQVAERQQQGDPAGRYFYELLAQVAKPPVSTNRLEMEPNNQPEAGIFLEDGDSILGFMDASWDFDWYRVEVPPGRHTVTLELTANHVGSGGSFGMLLVNSENEPLPLGCNRCEVETPIGGYGVDPGIRWESQGDEELRVAVYERQGRNGRPIWYALRVELEGP